MITSDLPESRGTFDIPKNIQGTLIIKQSTMLCNIVTTSYTSGIGYLVVEQPPLKEDHSDACLAEVCAPQVLVL